MRRSFVARRVVVLVLAMAWTSLARADDPAAAQALFDQARALMAEERWTEACPKLEESQRLDPAGGTLLHLALCREREGRIATAWALYHDALVQAKRENRRDRAKVAEERIAVLTPRLPRMQIKVDEANAALRNFRLTRDGDEVGEAQWGESVPVDPGRRELRAEADGRRPWTAAVELVEKAELAISVPELAPAPPAEESAPPRDPDRDAAGSRGDTQRTLGLVTGGVGIAAIVTGSVFGVISMTQRDKADAACAPPDRRLCSASGVEAGDAAIAAGNASTVAFVLGGVLVAAGATLYLTAPSRGSLAVAPSAGARGAALSLVGRFW
jgi:hypothetical protein